MLLWHGADMHARDDQGHTALWHAAHMASPSNSRAIRCVALLLDHGAAAGGGGPERRQTASRYGGMVHTSPLHYLAGASRGAPDMDSLIVHTLGQAASSAAAAVAANARDMDGCTPLYGAAGCGRVCAVRVLCAYGACPRSAEDQ